MSMQYLEGQDFYVMNTERGPKLCLRSRNLTVVFFFVARCPVSSRLMPEYQQLSMEVPNVEFAAIDLDMCPDVAQMTHQTSEPIEEVPRFIMYYGGTPYAVYEGKYNGYGIRRFITTCLNSTKSKQQFYQPPPQYPPPQAAPQQGPYGMGRPPQSRRRPRRDPSGMRSEDYGYDEMPRQPPSGGRAPPRADAPRGAGRGESRFAQMYETTGASEYAFYEDAYPGAKGGIEAITRDGER